MCMNMGRDMGRDAGAAKGTDVPKGMQKVKKGTGPVSTSLILMQRHEWVELGNELQPQLCIHSVLGFLEP